MSAPEPRSLSARPSSALQTRLALTIEAAAGWLPFDRFMALALYEPGLGYYSRGGRIFGELPDSGSDFVTAPELSPLFGAALARQVAQALQAAQSGDILEFGAGSGALAEQLLQALGERVQRYRIVDLSGALRSRQAQRLARWSHKLEWLQQWPEQIDGVVLGNEVLDAMPVQLLHWDGRQWWERGVAFAPQGGAAQSGSPQGGSAQADLPLVWADRATALRPPEAEGFEPGTVTEIHPQAEAFIRGLAQRLRCGAAFFIDYGFPQAEYYHPQRVEGTLVCHRAHRVDALPLQDLGDKDITAHVNFSAIALAGQDAGLEVLGYTSQAHFLINCGLLDLLPALQTAADARLLAGTQKLLNEHEMGELFKVIGFSRGINLDALGFARGDRSHTL